MSEVFLCPSCRSEVDSISLERCTGCGLPFPAELRSKLKAAYKDSLVDIRFSQVVKQRSAPTPAAIPVATPEQIVIGDVNPWEMPEQSQRERWADSFYARVALRAGVGLAIWSVLVSILGVLALLPAAVALLLCMLSLAGNERGWAWLGLGCSVGATAIVFFVMNMQTFR